MSDLITHEGTWIEQLIKDCLLPIDAAAILQQPLGRGDADFWASSMEKSGTYTVRSAYKLLHKRKSEALFSQQPSSSGDGIWKKVWKLDVPPKMSVLVASHE